MGTTNKNKPILKSTTISPKTFLLIVLKRANTMK